jgi:hypothetical protein
MSVIDMTAFDKELNRCAPEKHQSGRQTGRRTIVLMVASDKDYKSSGWPITPLQEKTGRSGGRQPNPGGRERERERRRSVLYDVCSSRRHKLETRISF